MVCVGLCLFVAFPYVLFCIVFNFQWCHCFYIKMLGANFILNMKNQYLANATRHHILRCTNDFLKRKRIVIQPVRWVPVTHVT